MKKKPLTTEEKADFEKAGLQSPWVCPNCDSMDHEGKQVEVTLGEEFGFVTQEVKCLTCEMKWRLGFKLSSFHILS